MLLLHDAPAGFRGLKSDLFLPITVRAEADRTRHLLQDAVMELKPRLVFCGHWHQRRTDTLKGPQGSSTEVHVLNDDTSWAGNLVSAATDQANLRVEALMIRA